ncbi:hypothetical protein [Thermococcus peptonophilus]|uniref:hypothetical protein n=1 Tax=Thermococcus peptonophilus TaxID=53952 RepID=UPI0034668E1B
MAIYSETVRSWKMLLIMFPAFISMAIGIGASYMVGENVTPLLIIFPPQLW